MGYKEIIAQLKSIHGKDTKRLFSAELKAAWAVNQAPSAFTPMIESILFKMGVKVDGKLNSNTANAICSKLDLN